MPRRALPTVAIVIAAILLASATVGWDLGTAPLADWDEGHHAKVALDMLRTGDWLVYAVDGEVEPWSVKPPAFYWMLAGVMELLGPTETAVRIGPAACFVVAVAVTGALAARVLGLGAAAIAVWLLATSRPLLFDHFARHGAADAPLALCLAVAMYGFWREPARGARATATVALAAALLLKGVAALQIVPAVVLWAWLEDDRRPCRALPPVVAVAAIPSVVWLAARELARPGFAAHVLWHDVVGRVTATVGAPRAHALLYVDEWVSDFWRIVTIAIALALAAGAPTTRADDERRLLRFLACWWLVPMAVFSIAQTKHEWYVLPSYLPAYVLAAWLVADASARLHARLPRRWATVAVAAIALAAFAFTSGKTLSAVFKRRPVLAAVQRRDLERFVAVATTLGRERELALFRPHELQAERFYLTRAGVPYHRFAEDGVEGSRDVLVARRSLPDLVRARPTSRVITEFPGLASALASVP
jgi:4-amino-4-deoxy-L-arabinose transferase-like glycosyltransferase